MELNKDELFNTTATQFPIRVITIEIVGGIENGGMEGQSGQKEHFLILINDLLILINDLLILINDLLILIIFINIDKYLLILRSIY